jgi:hypothetical protein
VCCSLGLALALGRALILVRLVFIRFVFIGFVFIRCVLIRFFLIRFVVFSVVFRSFFFGCISIGFFLIRPVLLLVISITPTASNMALKKFTKKAKATSTLRLQNIADRPLATQVQTPLERWQYVPAAIAAETGECGHGGKRWKFWKS